MKNITLIQGPNLNALGTREPHLYGQTTLEELHNNLIHKAQELGISLNCYQSNHEGEIIDRIYQCVAHRDLGIIINPAAYTHTSVAVRDALLAVREKLILIEVHLSIPQSRESFRHPNLISDIVHGRVEGFGVFGYQLALLATSTLVSACGKHRDQ